MENAAAYRLEILDETETTMLSAMLVSPITSYRAPSWFWEKFAERNANWRVIALDENGKKSVKPGRKRF